MSIENARRPLGGWSTVPHPAGELYKYSPPFLSIWNFSPLGLAHRQIDRGSITSPFTSALLNCKLRCTIT